VITAELKGKIDRVWDVFWSGGISNPLEIIEQTSYLMFLRLLEDMQTAKERKAARTNSPVEDPIYTEETQCLRWSYFVNEFPQQMLSTLRDEVFPWLHAQHQKEFALYRDARDVRFTIPTPNLLARVVDILNEIPLNKWEIWEDFYEYILSKIAVAGRYGQFRTPRHIVQLIIEMMAPGPADEICDPTCGTAGFLVAAADYVNRAPIEALTEPRQYRRGNGSRFHGFDFDRTMLRIASMNMLVHGVEKPDIRYRDSLTESTVGEAGRYSMILADPPFAGSLDYEAAARELLAIVKTHKTELLFLVLFLRLLKAGGRAAIIVPEGVLFGSTAAHKKIRRILVEDQKLEAVVKLPSGVFKPYAGVSTSILFFTKTDSGGTDYVWFYEVIADGWSLDDKRKKLLADDKLGPVPISALSETDLARNNLPDVVVPLLAFCILSDCPTCLAPELYYPDRLTSSTAQLKSLDRGHELESDVVFKHLSPNT
jgi:type I restriction enzyme M protein